jgi:Predicted membrane protein (DUF2232)
MGSESVPADTEISQPPVGSFREIVAAGFITTLLFAAFLAFPIIGALALPFLPVPAVRLAHRRGGGAGVAAALLSASLLLGLGFATGGAGAAVGGALFAAVVTGLPPLFAAGARRGADPSRAYLALCAAGFALITGGLALRPAAGGTSMRQEVAAAFDEMAPAAIQSYTRGGMDADAVARLKATLTASRDFASRFWIGLVGVTWVVASAIGFYAGARFARPAPSAEAVRFEALSMPPAVVVLFVAAGAGTVLAPVPVREIAGNALIPLSALYFLAGLSIICHFARKWFRAKILRVGLYGLALYFPINVGVGLLGLFDWYGDFRHRGEKV